MSKELEIGEILLKLVESDALIVGHRTAFSGNYYRVLVMESVEISVGTEWLAQDFTISGYQTDELKRNAFIQIELNLPSKLGKQLRKAFIANYKRNTKKKNEEAARKYSEAQQKLLDKVHEALKTLV